VTGNLKKTNETLTVNVNNVSLKKSKEKKKNCHSPPFQEAVHLQKNSKEKKNKEKKKINSPPKSIKKLKKETLVTFRKKCDRLQFAVFDVLRI